MESVKRYYVGKYGYVVSAADFDLVSAENLALQQRLTVQDQREDDLKGLLEEALGSVYAEAGRAESNFAHKNATALAERIESALNPTAEAESHVD